MQVRHEALRLRESRVGDRGQDLDRRRVVLLPHRGDPLGGEPLRVRRLEVRRGGEEARRNPRARFLRHERGHRDHRHLRRLEAVVGDQPAQVLREILRGVPVLLPQLRPQLVQLQLGVRVILVRREQQPCAPLDRILVTPLAVREAHSGRPQTIRVAGDRGEQKEIGGLAEILRHPLAVVVHLAQAEERIGPTLQGGEGEETRRPRQILRGPQPLLVQVRHQRLRLVMSPLGERGQDAHRRRIVLVAHRGETLRELRVHVGALPRCRCRRARHPLGGSDRDGDGEEEDGEEYEELRQLALHGDRNRGEGDWGGERGYLTSVSRSSITLLIPGTPRLSRTRAWASIPWSRR